MDKYVTLPKYIREVYIPPELGGDCLGDLKMATE